MKSSSMRQADLHTIANYVDSIFSFGSNPEACYVVLLGLYEGSGNQLRGYSAILISRSGAVMERIYSLPKVAVDASIEEFISKVQSFGLAIAQLSFFETVGFITNFARFSSSSEDSAVGKLPTAVELLLGSLLQKNDTRIFRVQAEVVNDIPKNDAPPLVGIRSKSSKLSKEPNPSTTRRKKLGLISRAVKIFTVEDYGVGTVEEFEAKLPELNRSTISRLIEVRKHWRQYGNVASSHLQTGYLISMAGIIKEYERRVRKVGSANAYTPRENVLKKILLGSPDLMARMKIKDLEDVIDIVYEVVLDMVTRPK